LSSSSRGRIGVEAGRIADLLTLFRMASAVLIAVALATGALGVTAMLLSAAWLSDALDGRMARLGGRTRLGEWDVLADAMVGAGAAIGLALAGVLPVWPVLVAVIGLGGLLVAGNLAAGMLLQLTGFLPLLWRLWAERPSAWWLPFLTALVIGAVEWRKLIYVSIPNFIRGMAGQFERSGRGQTPGVDGDR
jgi:phosphatidylglycerophosphate synthase